MSKKRFIFLWCLVLSLSLGVFSSPVRAEEQYPDVLLSVFFTSAEDVTDTIYMSVDGYNFYELSVPFKDDTPNDKSGEHAAGMPDGVGTFHDPSIMYKDGYFWMISGYADGVVDKGTRRAIPMMSYSKDLIHWSYGSSGFPRLEDNLKPENTPPGEERWRAAGLDGWDFGSCDFMLDDDGTVWVLFVLGFYADYHAGNEFGWKLGDDLMAPYLAKITNLEPGKDPEFYINQATPKVTYDGGAKPIVLPIESDNRIDGSLYKENGWYYYSVKEHGIVNELWRIRDLNQCSNSDAWELVSPNMQGGSEGPSLTKFNGKYLLYTDKLAPWPAESEAEAENYSKSVFWNVTEGIGAYGDSTHGNYVCVNEDINDPYGWGGAHKVKTWDAKGKLKENRHGTVIAVTDDTAKKVIWGRYRELYGDKEPANEDIPQDEGWIRKDYQEYYWYENGVRQGYQPDKSRSDKPYQPDLSYRGKEIHDPNANGGLGGWFWLDNISGGAMAYDKDVYQESWAGPYADNEDGTGKWVRYDYYGSMKKGVQYDQAHDHREPNDPWYWYYFDPITGAMAKGYAELEDGRRQYYDKITGQLVVGEKLMEDGTLFLSDEAGAVWNGWYTPDGDKPESEWKWYWYEDGVRQGYNAYDSEYRGKEIADPETGLWYWLDNIAMGAKAVDKDVYQESWAGPYADREDGTGKWVYYDAGGVMFKGWDTFTHPGYTRYFDPIYGAMAKGEAWIDNQHWYFDLVTGYGTRIE